MSNFVTEWSYQGDRLNVLQGLYDQGGYSAVLDSNNNIYIVYTINSGNPVSGQTSVGDNDVVVCKMDASGSVIWLRQNNITNTIVQDYTLTTNCIDIDSNNNIYVTYQSSGVSSGQKSSGSRDIIIFKMNSDGDVLWIKQDNTINSSLIESGSSLNVDLSGNIYVFYTTTGTISGQVKTSTSPFSDLVICKINTHGTTLWVRQNSIINPSTPVGSIQSFVLDKVNNYIYIAYITSGVASGVTRISSSNTNVVIKMDAGGNVIWIRQNLLYAQGAAPSIATDLYGNIYLCDYTTGSASGQRTKGSQDIVICKINPAGNVVWVSQPSLMNTSSKDYNPNIRIDNNGYIYIGYITEGTISGESRTGIGGDYVICKLNADGIVESITQSPLFNTSYNDVLIPELIVSSSGDVFIMYPTLGTLPNKIHASKSTDIVVAKLNSEGTIQWIKQNEYLNSYMIESSPNIIVSPDGYTYIVYTTYGTVSGNTNTTSSTLLTNDIVVAKLDSSGNIIWTKQNNRMNTLANDNTPAIISDSSGNIFVAYRTYGVSSGQTQLLSSYTDIVVFKMNSSGNVVWIRQNRSMNTISDDSEPSISVDTFGNVYVSYYTLGTASGQQVGRPFDIVVFKINTSGNVEWVTQQYAMNTSLNDINPSMVVDINNNIYISYSTVGVTSGQNRTGTLSDIVVVKLNTSGEVLWVRQNSIMNTTESEITPAITTDSSGYIYITYITSGTVSGQTKTLTNSQSDIVVIKMDQSGSIVWVRQTQLMNTESDDSNPCIVTDSSGNIYVSYQTTGAISGATKSGMSDIVIIKIDNSGNILWVRQNTSLNSIYAEQFPSLAISSAGEIYLTYTTDGIIGEKNIGPHDLTITKLRQVPIFPPQITQNMSLGAYLASAAPNITSANKQELKDYILQNRSSFASPIVDVSGSIMSLLVDSIASGYSFEPNVVVVLPSVSTVDISSYITDLLAGTKSLYLFGASGTTQTLLANGTTYSFTVTASGFQYGGNSYGLNQTAILDSNYCFTPKSLGSVGGVLTAFPPAIPSGASLTDYLSLIAPFITSSNKSAMKNYILQNRSSFASPVASLPGSTIAKLIDTQASGYNVSASSSVLTILPVSDGQTTSPSSYADITSYLAPPMNIYFFGTTGFVHTIKIHDMIYSFTMTDTGLILNNIAYGLGDNVTFGSYRLAIKYLGCVGGELTQIAPIPPAETGTNIAYPAHYVNFTAHTVVNESRAAIVSPFAGNYTGSTTASIGVTDITNQQYFTGIDAVFEKTLTESEVIQILNTFRIRDTNVDLGYDMIPGSIRPDGTYNPPANTQDYANFNVDLVNIDDFKSVLTSVMIQANQISGKQLPNVTAYFQEEMRAEMDLQLKNSGLLDMLEASNVTDVVVNLQFNNGAQDMASNIAATDAPGQSVIADKRRQFLTQIPLETLQQYLAEAQREIHYLPLKGGDSMTFVFDVTVQAPSFLSATVNNVYDNGPGAYKTTLNNINMDSERRRVAFVVNLTDKNTYFRRDFASVTAAGAPVITNIADAKRYVKEQTQTLAIYGPTYVSALQAVTVVSPFTSAEWIAQAKYELARDEQAAYASSGSYTSHITSIRPSV